jgi:hypothetical protein
MIRIISSLLLSLIFAYSVAQNTAVNFGTNTTCKFETDDGTPLTIVFNKPGASAAPKATFSVNGQQMSIAPNAQAYENSLNLMLNTGAVTENDNLFWLSKARFYEITMGKTMFYINGPQNMFGMAVAGKETIHLKVNGNIVNTEAYHLKSVGNGPALDMWVLNNDKNPVVVKTTGFVNLHLAEISY